MDILQDFIKSLEKEELKSYKLYTKRSHDFDNRKDIELFESIKKNAEEPDSFHYISLYKKGKPDAKYYRLKNKITDDLGIVLTNLNHRKTEIDALHLLSLAKIFNQKKQFTLTYHYLKLAERKAFSKEDFALLEAIYEQMIRLSLHHVELSPSELITKRNENSKRLLLLQELENNLAILSHEVKTTQNLTPKKVFTDWLEQTLKSTLKLAYVKNSPQLRIKLFQNLSRLLLLLKDYQSLEQYLKTCLTEFETDKLFSKQTHDVKLQLLVYLCNASFVLEKYSQSLHYAQVLFTSLNEYDKIQYNNYVFYYYNILVNNYSKTNVEKAIDTLIEAQLQPVIKSNATHYFYVLSNLATSYFDTKKYKLASKLFSQMYVSQSYKAFDGSFKIKISVFELINKIELEDFDICLKQLYQIEKIMLDIKDKESVKIELELLKVLELYLTQDDVKWRPIKPKIIAYCKKYPSEGLVSGLINYTNWLNTKV